MTKKERLILALCAVLAAALFLTVFALEASGRAMLRISDFTADEAGTLYVAGPRQVRVVAADHSVVTFRPAIRSIDHIETDGQTVRLFSGARYLLLDRSGNTVEYGTLEEKPDWDSVRFAPVIQGDTTYSLHAFLGIYRIEKRTGNETTVCCRSTGWDIAVRIMLALGALIILGAGISFPVYFTANRRFAKGGTILPPCNNGNRKDRKIGETV